MFAAPPFSMFRYAIREVRPMPGSFHMPPSRRSNPQSDSEDVDEYILREVRRILDMSELVSSSCEDDVLIMETSF